MQLIIKARYNYGLAAHIPTMDGKPLCHTRLRRTDWRVVEASVDSAEICRTCQRRAIQQHVSSVANTPPADTETSGTITHTLR
jgi:hypothetical protein